MNEVQKIFNTLQKVLDSKFEVRENLVKPETTLVELGLDSLTLMEFIFEAEDTFHLRIPEDKLNQDFSMVSLKDISLLILDIQSKI
jgi:acyl carrier protein